MNQRLQSFLESHPWAAPIVVALNWIFAAVEWTARHADDLTRCFALASSMIGLGVVWYTFRIKRREFRSKF